MAYLNSYRGDYLAAMRGDPGLFGSIGRALGGVARTVGSFVPGPVGAVLSGAGRVLAPTRSQPRPSVMSVRAPTVSTRVTAFPPTYSRTVSPAMPAVPRMSMTAGSTSALRAAQGLGRKRRRMNVTNSKALRRAIRRQAGFVKLARKALQGTGYTIVSRGSRARKSISVRESGPGSVTVR